MSFPVDSKHLTWRTSLRGTWKPRLAPHWGSVHPPKPITSKLWGDKFWSRSYCLISVGNGIPVEIIKQYLQNQEKPSWRAVHYPSSPKHRLDGEFCGTTFVKRNHINICIDFWLTQHWSMTHIVLTFDPLSMTYDPPKYWLMTLQNIDLWPSKNTLQTRSVLDLRKS